MRILITNDDGINAPGLKVANKIAKSIIGNKKGEITITKSKSRCANNLPLTEEVGKAIANYCHASGGIRKFAVSF